MTDQIAHLTSRALISLSGPDWRPFLQGLITQDVETMQPGELRYGALLTPQGRLSHDLFIVADGDDGVLDVAAAARDDLITRLTMYRLRAKVRIDALPQNVYAAWADAPSTTGNVWRPDPRLADLGRRAYGEDIGATASETDFVQHRLALGVPDPASDATQSDYPIEANLDLLHGVDFKKGCFVGQETTSRMHRRGVVKTRMAPVAFDGAPPAFGAEILAGERRAGEMRGGVFGRGMALLRIDRSHETLICEGRRITLDPPAWLAPWFRQSIEETS